MKKPCYAATVRCVPVRAGNAKVGAKRPISGATMKGGGVRLLIQNGGKAETAGKLLKLNLILRST